MSHAVQGLKGKKKAPSISFAASLKGTCCGDASERRHSSFCTVSVKKLMQLRLYEISGAAWNTVILNVCTFPS